MNIENGHLLSVLIPTLESRETRCRELCDELQRQINQLEAPGMVEVLTLSDDGSESIGRKRNQLIRMAVGRFVVFVDDDDSVSKNYIEQIVGAIRDNPDADCVSFVGEIRFRGAHPRKLVHSITHKDWCHSGGEYVRPPCHITPIRRDIALKYRFASADRAEDMEWAMRMSSDGALKREVVLDEVLYHYLSRRSYAYQWTLDRTQSIRHALGLRHVRPRETASGRQSLLFVSNNLCAYGGGNCVVAWSLMAVREEWDVTLLCAIEPDFDEINKHFGTDLRKSEFHIRALPFPLNQVRKLDPDPFSFQPLSWLMWFSQREAHRYDALVTCDDEFDFGHPGVQYTHFPHLQRHTDAILSIEGLSFGQRLRKFLTGNLRPWLLVSGISIKRIRENRIVTNSHWTANVIRDIYGVEPVVVYPPVRWTGPQRSAEQRKDAFVCIGRLSPQKRYPEIIDIIEGVRARGFDVELNIIGDEDAVAGDEHVQVIRARMEAAGDWVKMHKSISREELEDLVSGCRFGIHGMLDEHFGIAPAELMRGGCIVFVSNSGGQVEIVGDNPELKYDSDRDAVEKICRVLADRETQSRLREALRKQSDLFSETHFMSHMREIVSGFQNLGPDTSRSEKL